MKRFLVVAGLALGIGVVIAVSPGHRGWFDLNVYHGAVTYWVGADGDLYAYLRPRSTYGFTYPPFAALCMTPMAYLGWHTTIVIHLLVTAAAAALLLYVLVDPVARRRGWSRWYALGLAACAFAALSPVRDTVSFGQINLLLVALVWADLVLLDRTDGWRSIAGVGIGLAAAIKLTPGIFVIYLLLTRRWRAAATAGMTAAAGTMLAAVLAPDETRTYFTEALWNTSRIGQLDYISNQSLMGVVARLNLPHVVWAVAAVAVLVVWVRRSRSAPLRTGFALTAVVSCLISPITWVHHLVWLVPALAVLLASAEPGLRRAGIAAYAVLVSSVVWLWSLDHSGVLGFVGGNAYVWVALGLFLVCGSARPAPVSDCAQHVHTVGDPFRMQRSPAASGIGRGFGARPPRLGDGHREQLRQQVGRAP